MKDIRVVVGVTGGIAAYKACEIVSSLTKLGADVHVVMTKNACEFVSPLTFWSLSKNKVTVGLFEGDKSATQHISLAKECDIALIAPCTANVIGKIAAGIADDFLTTFVMACKAPIVIAPAMNTNMYQSEAYQSNAATLKKRGFLFIEPSSGKLACGDTGKGRLRDPHEIVEFLQDIVQKKRDFRGKSLLITAGATLTKIDPVRYICNYSSGKMGIAIARAARLRGASVTLVLGKTTIDADLDCSIINVQTTAQMHQAVMENLQKADYIIKAAAPSDYVLGAINNKEIKDTKDNTNTNAPDLDVLAQNKIKDREITLTLKKGIDIAHEVGKIKGSKKLVIFAAESEDVLSNANKKLETKHADMVVANDITKEGAGFDVDTNIVSIITKDSLLHLPKMTKAQLADVILDNLLRLS